MENQLQSIDQSPSQSVIEWSMQRKSWNVKQLFYWCFYCFATFRPYYLIYSQIMLILHLTPPPLYTNRHTRCHGSRYIALKTLKLAPQHHKSFSACRPSVSAWLQFIFVVMREIVRFDWHLCVVIGCRISRSHNSVVTRRPPVTNQPF